MSESISEYRDHQLAELVLKVARDVRVTEQRLIRGMEEKGYDTLPLTSLQGHADAILKIMADKHVYDTNTLDKIQLIVHDMLNKI